MSERGGDMRPLDEIGMRFRLARLCDASSQKAVANRFGFSPQYVHDVLAGRRHVSDTLAAMMGFVRVVEFRPARRATATKASTQSSGRVRRERVAK